MNLRYRTLTLIALAVALIVGTIAKSLVQATLTPGTTTEFLAFLSFVGGVLGGLFGFVGFFRVREGKPFFPKFF